MILGVGQLSCERNPVESRDPGDLKIAFISSPGNRLYVMNSDGSDQILLSDGIEDHCWSPDGSRIVFASNIEGTYQGYLAKSDGSSRMKLTDMAEDAFGFRWSPDGSTIVFYSGRDSTNEIYSINVENGGSQRLTSNRVGDLSPDWSPDGSKIRFYRLDDTHQIWVMNPDGSGAIRLTNYESGIEWGSCWSPDGSRIAYVVSGGLHVMDANGNNKLRLSSFQTYPPAWSPDGSTLAFVSNHEGGPNPHIYLINPDGSHLRRLTNRSDEEFGPTWSPDGAVIAFSDAYKIIIFSRDGTNLKQLSCPSGCWGPKFSPVYY